MKVVRLAADSGLSTIYIKSGGIKDLGTLSRKYTQSKKAFIICDTNTFKYALLSKKSLEDVGVEAQIGCIGSGELQKNFKTLLRLYERFISFKLERTQLVFAVGGGVVGDLTGFAAATYKRGLTLFQVPTTLLAQIDASIGGKNALNLPRAKNAIGTFYQPRLILIDPTVLRTLDNNQYLTGLAEMIKYAVIKDPALFEMLKDRREQIIKRDINALEALIIRCVLIKASIVKKDEKDYGLRMILNYGHTIAHAIEAASGYKISHGKALAIGMTCEALISVNLGIANRNLLDSQTQLLNMYRFPTKLNAISLKKVADLLKQDKKVKDEKIRFVLPEKIGSVKYPVVVSEKEISRALNKISASNGSAADMI